MHQPATPSAAEVVPAPAILVVDPSAFFRNFVPSLLLGIGYDTTAVPTAGAAFALRDGGAAIDLAIVASDRPGDDGDRLAEDCRRGGAWATLPMIGLCTRLTRPLRARGRELGMAEHLEKLDPEALVLAVHRTLTNPGDAIAPERTMSTATPAA